MSAPATWPFSPCSSSSERASRQLSSLAIRLQPRSRPRLHVSLWSVRTSRCRMSMRRFPRLTDAFSTKAENHAFVPLQFMPHSPR
jgi:hypothetical protein